MGAHVSRNGGPLGPPEMGASAGRGYVPGSQGRAAGASSTRSDVG